MSANHPADRTSPASVGLPPHLLVAPRVTPVLDPWFRPAALSVRRIASDAAASGAGIRAAFAVEQPGGAVTHHEAWVYAAGHPDAAASYRAFERLVKFVLWSWGGARIHVDGPDPLVAYLRAYYATDPRGVFDDTLIGREVFGRELEVVAARRAEFPAQRDTKTELGRHLDGCRIGFDLGASDRKVAAVVDGEVVFSEEVLWDPANHADPQWHFEQIMDSLRSAAEHLPRVDAIGGSSAGSYVNNEVRVASLFRGVPRDLFATRVRGLFKELQQAWGGIPFEVINDGEVTALAGAMMAGVGGLLGIAMGSSQAAGYVDVDGRLGSRIDELAFAPVDYGPFAPADEWSGDVGCGVQYFSQQATARLLPVAGIEVEAGLPLPQRLVALQQLMEAGDDRAAKVYRTIGTYLGYALLHYQDFYRLDHLLLLGRVMTGRGGDLIMDGAREVLGTEDPAAGERIVFHVASERDKRHGQAVAAASLPALG